MGATGKHWIDQRRHALHTSDSLHWIQVLKFFYPLVVYQSSLLKMAIDMADLPIKNGHVP